MKISRVVVQRLVRRNRFVQRDLSREFDLPVGRINEDPEIRRDDSNDTLGYRLPFLPSDVPFLRDRLRVSLLRSDFASEIFFSSLRAKAARKGRPSVEASLLTRKDVNAETVLPRVAK